jgi:hypothetical protein
LKGAGKKTKGGRRKEEEQTKRQRQRQTDRDRQTETETETEKETETETEQTETETETDREADHILSIELVNEGVVRYSSKQCLLELSVFELCVRACVSKRERNSGSERESRSDKTGRMHR